MTVTPSTLAPSTGCRLSTADGRDLPLRAVHVATDAAGGLARAVLRQTFANPFAEPLAVTYLLPLPADGAVVAFAFTIAGRRTVGQVQRREDARRTFEQAVLQGRTAALLEQDRDDVFTQELGNVPPGAAVEVELEVEQPLAWVDGGWEWRWPTVVGPRFLGAPGLVPDAERVVVDVAAAVPVAASVELRVGDPTTGPARSPSHPVDASDGVVRLVGALDRDVVVRWPVAAEGARLGLETARTVGDPDAYALVTLVPPRADGAPVRRDLCLLLDTSGSMGGRPLQQLQACATALIGGLRDGDLLEVLEFSTATRRWREAPAPIDARTRADATAWVRGLRAGGGTAMHDAVTAALAPSSPEAQRQVVLMTDGYIGFETEVIGRILRQLPAGSRLHVVGVGSSVNRTLTRGAARAGGGLERILGLDEGTGSAVAELLARTGDPLWVDVRIEGSAVRQVAPATAPDLLAGCPARLSVRLDPAGGELVVRGRSAAGAFERRLPVPPVAEGQGRRVVAARFARERVQDVETAVAGGADAAAADAELEALGLRHQLATRRTSWVAVSAEATVDPSDPTRRVTQPHLLPYGVSAEGVGLARQPSAPPPPPSAAPLAARERLVTAATRAVPAGPVKRKAALHEVDDAPPKAAGLGRQQAEREENLDRLVREPAPLAAPAAPSAGPGGAARPALRARVVTLGDGRLVLEVTLDEATTWAPEPLEVEDAAGRRVRTTPVAGTTRAGAVAAGATVRLVLAWSGPLPARVYVSGRAVVVG